MMADLAATLGLSIFVIFSIVVVAWRMGRVEGRVAGVERSVERLQADVGRLRGGMNGLREDVKVILLRLTEKSEQAATLQRSLIRANRPSVT